MIDKTIRFPGFSAIALGIMLTACGGGGGNNSGATVTTSGTGTISGSVAGTTIIAVNSSGDIIATDDTAGRTRDVDTDGNGTLDAFSFTLNGIPFTEDVRVYLVTGGSIYPMYFDTDNDGVSDSNVFASSSGSTIQVALGFINIGIENGRAIPFNNPTNDNDVTGKGVIVEIPSSINEPPTASETVAELNSKGENALASGWVLGAKTYYQAAVNLAANSSGNDADTARFMLALTRVAALGFDTLSDGTPQDMGRLGDLLDLFGVADDNKRANRELIEAPVTLPTNSPTGNEIRDFSYDVVRPELQTAAANLDTVSTAFDTVLTDDSEVINVDYGDALFFSGLLRSMVASIEIQRAYDLNIDIDDVKNNNRTAENVHATNSTLLGQPDLMKLAEAKISLSAALTDMKSAIDSINAETDDQIDDLITIDATVDTAEIKTWIDETQASIDGNSTNIGTAAVNLQTFFNSGVILDDTTLPGIAGNDIDATNGFFNDPTMGGVIVDTDTTTPGVQNINKDTGPFDGIPDILQ